ncbi:hypothetical protein KQI84_06870 [bacterium]|nr:hypothetical protein [bacterium]
MRLLRTALLFALLLPGLLAAQGGGEVVLPGDEATTQTWHAVRMGLTAEVSPLRSLVRQGQREAELAEAVDAIERDLDLFQRHAEALAIEESAAIKEVRDKVDKLLDNLVYDYANGYGSQFPTTLRLLEESMARLEDLAKRSDIRIGRRGLGRYASMPDDWQAPKYPEPIIQPQIAMMTGNEICRTIRERADIMRREPKDSLENEGAVAGREIGELARALILRQGDVPPISRRGFRNTALQMDVISENMVEFAQKNDWPNYRRQIIVLDEALERAFLYLEMGE